MSLMQQLSLGTEGDVRYEMIDEKKKRRMISNRESARRSRQKKQQRLEDLLRERDQLLREKSELFLKLNEITQVTVPFETENNVLRAQVTELNARLNYLTTFESDSQRNGPNGAVGTHYNGGLFSAGTTASPYQQGFDGFQDVGEFLVDGPDPLLRPWQSSYSSQPIMASAGMFQF